MTAATTHLSKEARYCADTFNGAVAAAALGAAWDIGADEQLHRPGRLGSRRRSR